LIPRLSFETGAKVLKAVLAIAFLISGALGSYILATDSYLWAQAPTHADGLVAFVVLDLVAVAGIYALPRIARIVVLLLPVVQLAAMAGDLYMGLGSPGSVIQGAFHEYLLNDSAFMILLVLQAVLAALAFGNLLQPHPDPRAGRRGAGLSSMKATVAANRRAISRALIAAVVVVVVIVAGVGIYFATASNGASVSTSSTQYSGPPALQVSIYSGAANSANPPGYTPDSVTLVIGVNNTVTWTNNDSIHHTVTSTSAPSGGSFNSGNMNGGGATYTHTFTVPGMYQYDCEYHSWMTGTIVVKA